jgi:hypothetical protein
LRLKCNEVTILHVRVRIGHDEQVDEISSVFVCVNTTEEDGANAGIEIVEPKN